MADVQAIWVHWDRIVDKLNGCHFEPQVRHALCSGLRAERWRLTDADYKRANHGHECGTGEEKFLDWIQIRSGVAGQNGLNSTLQASPGYPGHTYQWQLCV